jgi:hypothetical protein
MRKTASHLNNLRADLKQCLEDIGQVGEQLDASCHDLSTIIPHDVRTESVDVRDRFEHVLNDYNELTNLLDVFRIARNKYLEFF